MELYVSRSGSVEGPYSREKIDAMLKEGQLVPMDLAAPPGASDWSPLSELLAPAAAGPPPLSVPPPLQTEPDTRYLDQQFMIDGKIPNGAHGKTVRQVVEKVAAGGRLVVYQYVFSLLVITFRRNTDVHYIAPGKSGAGQAFQWSIIPLLFGWWGFPWGFIHTPAALWRNTAGGVDVTEPILAQLIGPEKADAVVRKRPNTKGTLWGLRALFFSPLLLLPLLIMGLGMASARNERERGKQPGYPQFQQAESFVSRSKGAIAQGNSPAAIKAAGTFSTIMNEFMADTITRSDSTKKKLKSVSTWCEQHDKRCLFIVGVPALRRFSDEAKSSLGDIAWFAAQLSAASLDLPTDAELAVAIRGTLLYDRMTVGGLASEIDPQSPDIIELLKKSIRETNTASTLDDRLIPYFAPEQHGDNIEG